MNPATAQPAVDKATPRPWHIAKLCATLIVGADQARVADTDQGSGIGMSTEENRANADLIVRSVNQSAAVDAMVEVAQTMVCGFCGWQIVSQQPTAGPCESCLPLRAALAQVEQLRKGRQ